MELHGLLGHEELTGEPVVRRTRRDEAQELELTLGETEGLMRRARLRHGLTRADARVGHAVEDGAAHDLPQQRPRADRIDRLAEHGVGSRAHRVSSQSRPVSGTSRMTFASGSAAWTSAMRLTACGGAPRSSTITTSGRESASTAPTGAWPAT